MRERVPVNQSALHRISKELLGNPARLADGVFGQRLLRLPVGRFCAEQIQPEVFRVTSGDG